MVKTTLIFILTLLSIGFSYSQTKTTNEEVKKLASYLMESYYTAKASSSMPFTEECSQTIKRQIQNFSRILKTRLENNKKLVIVKIGASNVTELENLFKGYAEYAETSESDMSAQKRGGFMVWLGFWKSKVEEIFVKLNK